MIALSQFNSLSGDEAGELLAPCVAIPAWSDTLVNLRPFANREALLQVAREAMGDWGENDLNAALSGPAFVRWCPKCQPLYLWS